MISINSATKDPGFDTGCGPIRIVSNRRYKNIVSDMFYHIGMQNMQYLHQDNLKFKFIHNTYIHIDTINLNRSR